MRPFEVLRTELEQWRAAPAGPFPFAIAWPRAVAAAVAHSGDRDEWARLFEEIRPGVERAYNREPPIAAELALTRLIDLCDGDDYAPVADHICAHCEGEIPAERLRPAGVPARYCSERCRVDAATAARRARVAHAAEVAQTGRWHDLSKPPDRVGIHLARQPAGSSR